MNGRRIVSSNNNHPETTNNATRPPNKFYSVLAAFSAFVKFLKFEYLNLNQFIYNVCLPFIFKFAIFILDGIVASFGNIVFNLHYTDTDFNVENHAMYLDCIHIFFMYLIGIYNINMTAI